MDEIQGTLLRAVQLCLVALAQEIPVYQAWDQRIASFFFDSFFPDNLGHFVAVGRSGSSASVVLLDTNGHALASAASCANGHPNFSQLSAAAADAQGRIYVASVHNGLIQCVRYESLLGAVSRFPSIQWEHPSFYSDNPPVAIPDEQGGVGVAGIDINIGYYYGSLWKFECGTNATFHLSGFIDRGRPVAAMRLPNGDTFELFAETGYGQSSRIHLIRRNITGAPIFHINYGYTEHPHAAALDNGGNIVVGGSKRYGDKFSPWYPLVLKLAPDGSVLWRQVVTNFGGTMIAVAVDNSDNIIASGPAGTIKYSPDGRELWRAPDFGALVKTDSAGNILLTRGTYWVAIPLMVAQPAPVDTIKLSPDGSRLWHARFEVPGASDGGQRVTGLLVQDDAVYIGVRYSFSSGVSNALPGWIASIVKYVEDPSHPVDAQPRPAIVAAQNDACEVFNAGPCDTPPPPPPLPPAEVITTRLRDGKMAVRWPTNYSDYILQSARHLHRRHPERTRWKAVAAAPTCDTASCCVTNSIARFGKHYRIVAVK